MKTYKNLKKITMESQIKTQVVTLAVLLGIIYTFIILFSNSSEENTINKKLHFDFCACYKCSNPVRTRSQNK